MPLSWPFVTRSSKPAGDLAPQPHATAEQVEAARHDSKLAQVLYHDWEAENYDEKWSISYDQRCIDYARDCFDAAVPDEKSGETEEDVDLHDALLDALIERSAAKHPATARSARSPGPSPRAQRSGFLRHPPASNETTTSRPATRANPNTSALHSVDTGELLRG